MKNIFMILIALFVSNVGAQTYSADIKYNGIINESSGMTSEQLIKIFSNHPSYDAVCYVANRDFPENGKAATPSNIYKGKINMPEDTGAGAQKATLGVVKFNFKYLNSEAYEISSNIALDAKGAVKRMFNTADSISLFCPEDKSSVCRSLDGNISTEKEIAAVELLNPEIIKEKGYVKLKYSGQISIALPNDGDGGTLYMRLANRILVAGKGITRGFGRWAREDENSRVFDQYLGRYVCRLERVK